MPTTIPRNDCYFASILQRTQKDDLIELTTSLPVFTKSNSKASVVSDDSLPELVLDSKFDQNFEGIKTSKYKLGNHDPSLALSRKDSDH